MAELLQRIGSFELAEWAAEFSLRYEDEKAAIDAARAEGVS